MILSLSLTQVIFYVFAGLALFSALMVITQNNPVRCVLFLVLTFFASSILWMMMQAEFLSLILILVYVGAVMTLFLFVVMMLDIDLVTLKPQLVRFLPFTLIFLAGFMMLALKVLSPEQAAMQELTNHLVMNTVATSNTEQLGLVLYTEYAYALEIAAVLLVVAIIAAISLAHRSPRNCKTQNVIKQIDVNPADRIVLVKMQAETESASS